jgi:hypothetical protein
VDGVQHGTTHAGAEPALALPDMSTDAPQTATRSPAARSRVAALWVFVAVCVAGVAILRDFGRERWFFQDEWDFLATRNLSVDSLLSPHNEHWSTLPILAYRALWQLFGLRSYVPYQGVAILLHVTGAVLLRVVMRRADVSPWVATALASLFVFFGTGAMNILWAFQIGFTAAFVFGLAHLVLADHDGPFDRRDWVGLLAGAAGLMCSAVGVSMVVIVGIATLVSRGWRVALAHTAPLAALFGAWFVAYGSDSYGRDRSGFGETAAFVRSGVSGGFDGLAQSALGAWLLAGLLVAGLALRWRTAEGTRSFIRATAVPLAMLAGAFIFITIAGSGRAAEFGAEFARRGRYLYLVAGLVLPALGVAADALVRQWRAAAVVMVALLALAVAGNVDEFREQRTLDRELHQPYRRMLLAIPSLPLAREVPPTTRPDRLQARHVTVGWLLDGVASGRIPRIETTRPVSLLSARLYLALEQGGDFFRTYRTCEPFESSRTLRLDAGDAFYLRDGEATVTLVDDAGDRSRARPLDTERGEQFLALEGPLALVVEEDAEEPALWCGIVRATDVERVTGGQQPGS